MVLVLIQASFEVVMLDKSLDMVRDVLSAHLERGGNRIKGLGLLKRQEDRLLDGGQLELAVVLGRVLTSPYMSKDGAQKIGDFERLGNR